MSEVCPTCHRALPASTHAHASRPGRPRNATRVALEGLEKVGDEWATDDTSRTRIYQAARRVEKARGWKLAVRSAPVGMGTIRVVVRRVA